MINIFTPVANDTSLSYLAVIFSGMENIIIPGGVASASVLGAMFKSFNTAILSIAALIVVYTIVVGVLKTAHEGEFLGKHWNSLWVPIRTVIGIAALIPSTMGYSAIQIIMMWVVVQGVGAADTVWTTALNAKNTLGSIVKPQTTSASVTTSTDPTQDLMTTQARTPIKQLFSSLVCQQTALATYAGFTDDAPYYCSVNQCSTPQFDPSAGTFPMGPGGACGTLKPCDKNQLCAGGGDALGCKTCTAQISALNDTIIPGLTTVADLFVKTDYEYRQFYKTSNINGDNTAEWIKGYCSAKGYPEDSCCVKTAISISPRNAGCRTDFPPVNGGTAQSAPEQTVKMYWEYKIKPELQKAGFKSSSPVGEAVYAYSQAVFAAAASSTDRDNKFGNNTVLQEADKYGWIFAGGYYYYLAKKSDANISASLPSLSVDNNVMYTGGILSSYRNNIAAAEVIKNLAYNASAGGADSNTSGFSTDSGAPSELSALTGELTSVGGQIMQSFMHTVSYTDANAKLGSVVEEPLVRVQALGRGILIAIEILLLALLIVMVVLGLFSSLNTILTTLTSNPLGGMLSQVYMFFLPVILGFMGIFAVIGGLLAVYTPLIPYILFTFGAIGWFISVIEAMVAAPLVALGLLMPGGKDEIFGHAEHSLMMLFAIFLRPALMVFGLIAGILLSSVAVTLINAGFYNAMMGIIPQTAGLGQTAGGGVGAGQTSQPTLLELIFFMAAYVSIIITALNKSFSLIHVIPDRVLTWIGGHAGHADTEGLGEAKGAISGAAAPTQQVVGGSLEKGGGAAAGKIGEQQKKADKLKGSSGGVGAS